MKPGKRTLSSYFAFNKWKIECELLSYCFISKSGILLENKKQ